MSLGKMLGGAIDPHGLMQQLLQNGGNVIIVNHNMSGGKGKPDDDGDEYGGPDAENPAEDRAEGGQEEPADMMDAVKRAMGPPPKAPSPGVGKGPAPGTAGMPPKNPKLPEKKGGDSKVKAPPPKKGK